MGNPVLLPSYVGTTPATDHNLYVKDGYMYQANYRAGLRILKINEDRTLEEIGFFDVWPESNSAKFNGAWGVYPYFASGNIIVSSIEGGLFVVKSTNVVGATEHVRRYKRGTEWIREGLCFYAPFMCGGRS